MGPTGDFVVAWSSYIQDGSNFGVFGQRFATTPSASVTITAPGSTNETWAVGSVQRIRAEHDLGDGATFDIIVSHDAGGTFPSTAGSGVVGNSVVVNQLWTVTDNLGSPALPQSAKVQVVSVTPSSGVFDASLTFQIQSPCLIVDRPRNNVRVSGGTFTWRSRSRVDSALFSRPEFLGVGMACGSHRVAVFCVAALLGPVLEAQTPAPEYSEFQVNTYTTGDQYYRSAVAAIGTAGNFVVVWTSYNQDDPTNYNSGIFGQRFSSNGSKIGSEFQVNTYTSASQENPHVAALGTNGGFIVAWRSRLQSPTPQDGSQAGMFGQIYAADGSAQGGEFQINTYTTGYQEYGRILELTSGGDFVVVWNSGRFFDGAGTQDGSDGGIIGQRFDSAGSTIGSEFLVNEFTVGNQGEAAGAAVGTAGDFVVAWTDNPGDTSGFGVKARRFDSVGAPKGGEFLVNTYTTGRQHRAEVAAVGTAGDFVVAWRSADQDGSGYGVFAQRFASDGSSQGGEFQVNTYTTGGQASGNSNLAVTPVGTTGDFVIAWDSPQDGNNSGLFGQKFTSSGTPVGTEFQVNTYTTNSQNRPSMAALGTAGDFVVTWTSWRQDGGVPGGYGIFGQRMSPPDVKVTAPTATAEHWGIGSIQRIRAEHNLGDGATFDFSISRDGGYTFPDDAGMGIVGNSVAVNQWWTVTGPATTTARTRVTSASPSAGESDDSPVFRIENPTLVVKQPKGTVTSPATPTIVWTHNLGYRRLFKIELTRNNGGAWETIAAQAISPWAWRGEFTWTPTGTCAGVLQCKIRVTLLDPLGSTATGPGFTLVGY